MKNWRQIIGAIILLLAVLHQPVDVISVSAQSTARIKINRLDASRFPTINLEADVLQADGSFVPDLQPADFKVMENGILRPVDEVHETPNAVDFFVAINGGPILANRLSSKTHLQLIKDALLNWVPEAESIGKGDSVTLVTNAGVKASHLDSPDKWTAAFNTISPELIESVPSLTSLTKAVEQAIGAPAGPGMKQSILYITPLMSSGQTKAIESLADQAAGAGIQINIWLMAPSSAKQPQAEQSIQALAERTGGEVFRLTGKEALPPIETYLQPMRRQYEIVYRSRTSKSGTQVVALELQAEEIQARSPEENFEISVTAPNIMFVDPLESVDLTWQQTESSQSVLSPGEIPLKLHVEFPDKHPRNLVVTRLQVDGKVVNEKGGPSIDEIAWPVSSLKTSGIYNLQVIVKDELGLTSSTVNLPLEVNIPAPPAANWLAAISSERLALAIGAILLVIGGAFLAQYRIKKAREALRKKPASTRVDSRPLDRPGAVRTLRESNTIPVPGMVTSRDKTGWLLPQDSGDSISTQPSIRLGESVLTLGSSPIRAQVIIPSPSVDGLHARILRKPDGGYWLEDAGSVSGTWVNGTPVSNLGIALSPGDVIRIGKISFRFELRG
jgi:hypothetical protein